MVKALSKLPHHSRFVVVTPECLVFTKQFRTERQRCLQMNILFSQLLLTVCL